MDVIKLNEQDATILYCFPKGPSDLSYIVRSYTFINRDGPPTFEEITSVFSKSLRAGIVTESDGKYTVNYDWYRRININNGITKNEIDSMLLFIESIVGVELPVVNDSVSLFTQEDYRMALKEVRY